MTGCCRSAFSLARAAIRLHLKLLCDCAQVLLNSTLLLGCFKTAWQRSENCFGTAKPNWNTAFNACFEL
eukprot:11226144-Lingulodinium_polyedra.AAC.1